MDEFNIYLQLGLEHIADIKAYDHILFIVALCAVYQIREWKKIAILVTAFTIGHSLTLILSVLNITIVNASIIELLIPVTILLTCIYNILEIKKTKKNTYIKYIIALFFGLIHGWGFSNYLKSLLGMEENILIPLLGFNIGLEIGQLFIVAIVLTCSYFVLNILKIKRWIWVTALSIIVGIISINLITLNKIW